MQSKKAKGPVGQGDSAQRPWSMLVVRQPISNIHWCCPFDSLKLPTGSDILDLRSSKVWPCLKPICVKKTLNCQRFLSAKHHCLDNCLSFSASSYLWLLQVCSTDRLHVTFSISSSWSQCISLSWIRLWSCDWVLTNKIWVKVTWATTRHGHEMSLVTCPMLSLSVHQPAECRGPKGRLQDRRSLNPLPGEFLKTSNQIYVSGTK